MRKTISLTALAVAAAMAVAGLTALPAQAANTTLTLLNINDFHGRIDGNTVQFAGTIEQLRAAGGENNTALLAAGDLVGASVFASAIQHDDPAIDVLNALDLKASTVGNHEFDQGLADLTTHIIPRANWNYLGANVYNKNTTTPALPESTVLMIDGVRVAVIGGVTQETPTLVSPAGVASLTFGDPVAAVNREANRIKTNDLADLIVAEYHEGGADVTSLTEATASSPVFDAIVNQTSAAVDVIFTGHTHLAYNWDAPVPGQPGLTRPVVQTGNYGANIGQVTLNYDTSSGSLVSHSAANIARTTAAESDLVAAYPRVAEVKTIVDNALTYAAGIGSQEIGRISGDITTAFAGGSFVDGVWTGGTRDNRAEASALGTLAANAMRDSLADLPDGVQFGVINAGGGLRAELYYGTDGAITFAQANSVLPFNNEMTIMTMTGAQIITMLEQQWQRAADGTVPARPYLQLGLSDNISYTYSEFDDPDIPGAKLGKVNSVIIDGQAISLTTNYQVGTFNFLADGGDNFRVFTSAVKRFDTGLLDWDAWTKFLTARSVNGPIEPDFARPGVEVNGLATALQAGQEVSFEVAHLNTYSLGAAEVTDITVTLDGLAMGTFPVAAGAGSVNFEVPGNLSGTVNLVIAANVNGTTATIPIEISPSPAFQVLRQSMESAEAVRPGSYTAATYAALQAAIAQAKAVLANPQSTLAQALDAISRIVKALAGLVPVDKPTPTPTPTQPASPTAPPGKPHVTGPPSSAVAFVKAAQSSVTLVKGKSITLPAWGYTATGKKVAVKWSSQSKKIAKVSAKGKITAKRVGKTTIRFTAGGKTGKIKLVVVTTKAKLKVTKVTAKVPKVIAVGHVGLVKAKVKPAKATGVKVKFSTSNSAVLRVDKAGCLTAVKAGTAKVTVKAGGKSKSYKVTVQ